jgi:ring-1,2-phenylacetyl-CoA epoxidase subunit PaaC
MTGPDAPAARDPGVRALLLAAADDELIIGHRHSEWTGFAPDIESDVALSSIAQEEMGHARVLYEQVAALDGTSADQLAFGRRPDAFHNAVLLEQPNGDWAFTVVRAWLYDQADAVRLAALAASRLGEPAALARTLQREEKYHLLFSDAWLVRLARSGPDGHARVQAALSAAWPDAVGLFEAPPGIESIVEAGLLQAPAAQAAQWERTVRARLAELGLEVSAAAPRTGGRVGRHSPELFALLDEMTSVWRTDPAARW